MIGFINSLFQRIHEQLSNLYANRQQVSHYGKYSLVTKNNHTQISDLIRQFVVAVNDHASVAPQRRDTAFNRRWGAGKYFCKTPIEDQSGKPVSQRLRLFRFLTTSRFCDISIVNVC